MDFSDGYQTLPDHDLAVSGFKVSILPQLFGICHRKPEEARFHQGKLVIRAQVAEVSSTEPRRMRSGSMTRPRLETIVLKWR